MTGRRYGVGDGNTLRVTHGDAVHHVSEAHVRRQLRSVLAQRERAIQQFDAEIELHHELLAACGELGIRGEDLRVPRAQGTEGVGMTRLAQPTALTVGQRVWRFLNKPLGKKG